MEIRTVIRVFSYGVLLASCLSFASATFAAGPDNFQLAANADMFAYDASKGAVRALTKEVAAYCATRGYAIRCNSVHPGTIDTPMVSGFFDERSDDPSSWVASQAIKRFGTADEVAAMVAFLASDESSFSTGAEFVIDGGHMAGETQGWE